MAARIEDLQHDSDFTKILDKGGSGSVSVSLFLTSWAAQCQQMLEVMKELSLDSQFTHITFITVEAEDFPHLSLKYCITAVPTTIFIQNHKEVHRIDGVHAAELTSKVRQFAAQSQGVVASRNGQSEKQDLTTRLKALVRKAPVMLFMKGSPDQPKCGFSKQTIAILKEQDVKFDYFDILTDEEVRQGLKTFSDWPTYPQLYVDGELLGGLDIIKEMVENGEFKDAMPKQESLEDKLKRLISQADVMLFMKGNENEPRCKFSRATIDIMNATGVPYKTFDILQDEEVRQRLKTFSDWPTYPQLYVKGELIGGLDIIKEMHQNDELVTTLKGE